MTNRILYRVRAFFSRLGLVRGALLIIVLVAIIFGGVAFAKRGGSTVAAPQDTTPHVTLASVSDLSQGGSGLSVAGTVQSQTEATVRAEKGGEITAVHYALGDSVSAGTIVAEMENDSERAAVLQAQGAYQAAQAGATVSQTTLSGAKSSVVATLLSAYASVDTTIRTNIDPMFSNPESNQRAFIVPSADSQSKIYAEAGRGEMAAILTRENGKSSILSANDELIGELTATEGELRAVRDFLDTVIKTLNAGIATNGISDTTIATYKATATGARSTINSTLAAVSGAHQTLQTAIQNSAQGTGANSSSQAALTQAEGTLAAAKANLEKTIIRAPISGTINSLSLKRGDFVQMTSPVLTVANNHALEVISYITGNDTTRIAVGDKAKIEGDVDGTITRIAPAIDPLTKKIEVRIGLPANAAVTNGQSVVVDFVKPVASQTKPSKGPTTIPLSALKIGSDTIVVFTVDENSKLVPHPVTLGTLLGDRVVISSGVNPDMIIVTDARGLQAGQTVNVTK
jgi:RND family efflux transporter MFP subunit